MIEIVALVVVVLAGLYFLALGAASLFAPIRAGGFLLGFAGSAAAHYAELLVRIVVGAALVIHAPRMWRSEVFGLFGWVLLVTSACLLLVPWRWHRRFAQRFVPQVTRHLTLLGLASIAVGALVLAGVLRGGAG